MEAVEREAELVEEGSCLVIRSILTQVSYAVSHSVIDSLEGFLHHHHHHHHHNITTMTSRFFSPLETGRSAKAPLPPPRLTFGLTRRWSVRASLTSSFPPIFLLISLGLAWQWLQPRLLPLQLQLPQRQQLLLSSKQAHRLTQRQQHRPSLPAHSPSSSSSEPHPSSPSTL